MNHAVKAVVTLVFGAGLAVAAQAQGTNSQSGAPGGTTPSAQSTAPMPSTAPSATAPSTTAPTEKAVKPARMARHAVKARGLRHEVRQGRGTHLALSRFQQHRTASLDRTRVNRMSGGRATGVGSSAPGKQMTAPSQTGVGSDNATKGTNAKGY